MFKLYDMKKRDIITANNSEEVIYKAVCNICNKDKETILMIIKRENNGDTPYFSIRSEKDFELYKKFYEYSQLTHKSCIELRKEILELTEERKVLQKTK